MKKKLNWYKDRDEILEKMINAELKLHGKEMNDVLNKDNFKNILLKLKKSIQNGKNTVLI